MQNKYRLIALVLIAVFAASLAVADEGTMKTAKMVHQLAAKIMECRQKGVSVTDAMQVAEKADNKPMQNILRIMTLDAYKQPQFNTPEYQKKAINEFATKWYLKVIEVLEGK